MQMLKVYISVEIPVYKSTDIYVNNIYLFEIYVNFRHR